MKKKKQTIKKNESVVRAANIVKSTPVYISVLGFWSVYLYLTMSAPFDASNRLHMTKEAIDLLRLSFALPYLLIWLAAAYSFIRIKRYAVTIQPSREASSFHKIANGIILLLGSLILASTSSAAKNYFVDFTDLRPLLTIFTNYAYVVPYLFAFILLFRGVKELISQQGNGKMPFHNYFLYGIPLILFVYIWLELIFTNPSRVIPPAVDVSKFATYYLPDSLLVLTIVIPSIITWVLGLLTIIKLRLYYLKVKGVLYKLAFSSIVQGLIGVTLGSVFLQALLSLGPQRLINLGLEYILFLIYVFLFLQALGFFLIARGANKLTKIEAV